MSLIPDVSLNLDVPILNINLTIGVAVQVPQLDALGNVIQTYFWPTVPDAMTPNSMGGYYHHKRRQG